MLDDWSIVFTSDNETYAYIEKYDKKVNIEEWINYCVKNNLMRVEDKEEIVFIKQNDGNYKKEVRKSKVISTI